jgi:parvulin-like peptidyl-prolyl isomerase
VRLTDPREANTVFDELDRVARDVRAGGRDLAETARALSQDPSRREGGELGWAEARQLVAWSGSRVSGAVMAAATGELLGPLLVESYDSHRLVYVPKAWLLVRVEEVRPAGPTPFADVRADLPRLYRAKHAADIGRRMRADLLASIDAALAERP